MSIDWKSVERVLVVRLRSIGDTVLSTPSLSALKRFLPDASVDVLLEDWVAPVLDGFEDVDEVLTVGGDVSRFQMARHIRRRRYDVVFNLHGGTTATFFTYFSGARHRVGYRSYQYSFLYNTLLSSSAEFWGRDNTHSVEHQLALLGFAGVPVSASQRTSLAVVPSAIASLGRKVIESSGKSIRDLGEIALLHPAAAFATKEWATENFARVAESLCERGISVIAIASAKERSVLERLQTATRAPITFFDDLTLPEVTALASRSAIFVGNDSGIAHMAAAVNTPSVVIFGSSNRHHWRPWTNAPNEIVFDILPCQPCPGHECLEFGDPKCIQNVSVSAVLAAIGRVLSQTKRRP